MRKLIPKPVRKQLSKLPFITSPVWWANFGPAGRLLATHISPQSPPVVILSMPRSGSSWVGEILGISPKAMYLREPVTYTYLKQHPSYPSIFEIKKNKMPKAYEMYAKRAFQGYPLFSEPVVKFPKQWSILNRRSKRIVIKEVNPFILPWLTTTIRPRIIYLIRHPAAVTYSYERLGWHGRKFDSRLSRETLKKKIPYYKKFTHSFWAEHGAFQAFILREILKCSQAYPDFRIVRYKDLCLNPMTVFKDLYRFAELEWNDTVEAHIRQRTQPNTINTEPFSTSRNSRHEMQKWKQEVPAKKIALAKEAWLSFDLPYYQNDW